MGVLFFVFGILVVPLTLVHIVPLPFLKSCFALARKLGAALSALAFAQVIALLTICFKERQVEKFSQICYQMQFSNFVPQCLCVVE